MSKEMRQEIKRILDTMLKIYGTKAEIARQLGVSRPCVSQWFSEKRRPPIVHYLKMQKLEEQQNEQQRQ